MRYLVDGYNLLFKLSSSALSLEKNREHVLHLLESYIASLRIDMVIIFDGQNKAPDITRSHIGNLEVIYTAKNQTADAFILDELLVISPKNITVVTSDKSLATRSRALQARTLSIDEFLTFLAKKKNDIKKKDQEKPFIDSPNETKRLFLAFEEMLKKQK